MVGGIVGGGVEVKVGGTSVAVAVRVGGTSAVAVPGETGTVDVAIAQAVQAEMESTRNAPRTKRTDIGYLDNERRHRCRAAYGCSVLPIRIPSAQ